MQNFGSRARLTGAPADGPVRNFNAPWAVGRARLTRTQAPVGCAESQSRAPLTSEQAGSSQPCGPFGHSGLWDCSQGAIWNGVGRIFR